MIKEINKLQDKLYFQKIEINNKILISIFILLFLSIIINFSARYHEKKIWDSSPELFSAEGEPLVRTGDPAYFVSIAKYLKKNIPISRYHEKLNFPNKLDGINVDAPILSKIIAFFAKDSSTKELVRSGNNFILFSNTLTCIGVFFLFYVIGRPFEGIVASIGGGISTHYLLRSSIGYFDTDILNLFFMYFLFAMIYLSSKKQTIIRSTVLVIITGALAKLFYLWYPKT